jgi:hypothetical protein
MGRERCASAPCVAGRGTLGRACGCALGGHGEWLRRSRGDAAGIELGSSFAERIAVNTGTVPGLPGSCAASARMRAGPAVGRSAWGGAEPPWYSEPGRARRMGKLRRLTRRWIAPAGSRGSGGGAFGSPALPGRETGRGQQHGGKARDVVKALMAPPCKTRVIWRRPDCLKLSSQGWKCASSDYNA